MKNLICILWITVCLAVPVVTAQTIFESDTVKSAKGNIIITFIGHGTLMFEYNNKIIHVDPVSQYGDYSKVTRADIILVTHHHGDHLDIATLQKIVKPSTDLLLTATCAREVKLGTVINNGDSILVQGIKVEAVPAYNIVHERNKGEPYHPRGEGNGYVLTLGDKRIYIAGDTENIPEMKNLTAIDIAFLPMNLPYTMTPEMVAQAVRMFNPKILYPYHFGNTKLNELSALLKDKKNLEIRFRKLN
jgi:L-ascorbate metabolism protein UlaG (beta-lactamase superfamily)